MIADIPQYENLETYERGGTFHLDFESYRHLARTALGITHGLDAFMAIYKLPESHGAGLDIWSNERYLMISIDATANEISLFACGIDSAAPIPCLVVADNSAASWRRLGQIARKELA